MNSHAETRNPEAATSSTATSIDWDITLAELSSGIEQLLYREAGGRKGGTYPRLSTSGYVSPLSGHDPCRCDSNKLHI